MTSRILFLLHSVNPHSGTELHAKHLSEVLRDRYDVWFAYPENDVLYIANHSLTAPHTIPVDRVPWPLATVSSPQWQKAFDELLSFVNPAFVHIHHLFRWPLNTVQEIVKREKVVGMTFHDLYTCSPDLSYHPFPGATESTSSAYAQLAFGADISKNLRERRVILKEGIDLLNFRIAPSAFLKAEIEAAFDTTLQIVEHGIPSFKCPSTDPSNFVRFGFLGRSAPSKGLPLLKEAYEGVRDKLNGAELVVFERYSQADLPKILSEIDVGVVPAGYPEGYSLVTSEFFMGKKPVIAADTGALKERVFDNQNGRLFTTGDVQSLAETLVWFANNSAWRNWYISPPRTAEDMGFTYLSLYEESIGRGSR